MALCELGRFAEAGERANRQLEAAPVDSGATRLDALANLGVVYARQGDLERSTALLLKARELATELGDAMRLTIVTGDLAGNAFGGGRISEAAELLGQASNLAERLGSKRWVAFAMTNSAGVREMGGDFSGAERAAIAGARASVDIGDVALALTSLRVPIDVAEVEGSYSDAARWWQHHARLEERIGRTSDSVASWFNHASVLAVLGDRAAARRVYERTEVVAARLDSEDFGDELERATASIAGHYSLPVTAEREVELPALDASLPEATTEAVDQLFEQIDQMLTERESLAD